MQIYSVVLYWMITMKVLEKTKWQLLHLHLTTTSTTTGIQDTDMKVYLKDANIYWLDEPLEGAEARAAEILS